MGIGAGISFTVTGVLQALSNAVETVPGEILNTIASLVGPWRPPQWAKPAETSITVSGNAGSAYSASSLGVTNGGTGTPLTDDNGNALDILDATGVGITNGTAATPDVVYIFDAVFMLEHTQEIQLTEHPVQSGANISDHAFIKPARLGIDIGMSDAMQSYTIGQWAGNLSKSVSAYQTMLALELSRVPVTVKTRLNTYTNMVIVGIHTRDENKTNHGLRASITFQQVFMGTANTQSASSSRPQDTGSTGIGSVPTTTVPAVVDNTYVEPTPLVSAPTVSGAGNYSSNPVIDDPDDSIGS